MTTKSKTQEKHKMSEIDENIARLFDIKKRLGKGAYGIVWKALDKRTNETLAVKKIFDAFRDETDAQRTFREIIFLKAFRSHPNVIKLNNVYKASNNLDIYLIFEYMESDLHNIIKKGTILKDIHKRYVMYQLINAIKYIHSGNVIHRDLKPSNVLIDSKCRCKLADFGLARSVSNRPMRNSSDMGSEAVLIEPLLTDYVATRWYRAPEILVASKRYTKGIDMWSLGCILGEMIRGKPLFQGSSTVNQIEKIVTALPDVTEHDIKAVGAGFGSVLLSKQISRDIKTSLNDLLSDAPEDAINLVKSLLVLDPLARLTAKQALGHSYVEKFRNTIPELELNVDILPPFRDDVRLTVPEYRSKLYEIVQLTTEKANSLRQNVASTKNVTNSKLRDPKPQSGYEKTDYIKKITKSKQPQNTEEKYISKEKYFNRPEKHEIETNNAIYKTLPKTTSPKQKRKSSKTAKPLPIETQKTFQQIDDRPHYVSKAQTKYEPFEDSNRIYVYEKRHHSIDCGYGSQQDGCAAAKNPPTPNGVLRKVDNSNRLYKSSSSLSRAAELHHMHNSSSPIEKEIHEKRLDTNERYNRSTPIVANLGQKVTYLRDTKSDMIAAANTTTPTSKAQERICYEKRLKRLEEEIAKYKKEVKSFCKETNHCTNNNQPTESHSKTSLHHHTQHRARHSSCNTTTPATTTSMMKSTNLPAMLSCGTPKKNPYFQQLSKGNRDFGSDHSGRPFNSSMEMLNEKSKHQDYNYHHSHHHQHPRIRPIKYI